MKDYTTITGNNNGLPFPLTRAVDATGPLAVDGTEFLKETVDDAWAQKQALLDFYGVTPNGLEDGNGVDAGGLPISQPLAAQYMNFGTPGIVVNWPSEQDPAIVGAGLGIDIRLLLLHGQGIDRTQDAYKMLDSIMYIGDPDNPTADAFYHANDAGGVTRATTGDWLILPDARGYSWRALDPTGAIDPDGASRIVGHKQDDAMQAITGSFFIRQKGPQTPREIISDLGGNGVFSVNASTFPAVSTSEMESTLPGSAKELNRIDFDTSNALIPFKTNDFETHVKNIATHYAIYY